MSSVIVLPLLTILFSASLVLTQTTETAQLHIVDDAFGGKHPDGATFHGSAAISGSATYYTVDCRSGMSGCAGDSFTFTEISGTTTYVISDGPYSDFVFCGPTTVPNADLCTRVPNTGEYVIDPHGNSVTATSSTDSGYFVVYLTSLADDAASAIGATMASVTLSTVTNTISLTPAPSPSNQLISQTKSSAIASPTTSPPGGLSHSGEIGVGVGVALGAVFAAVLGVFGWKKWRARRSPEYSPPELYPGAVEQRGTGAMVRLRGLEAGVRLR